MDYFRIIHLNREPFSNSPDPDYFFQSRQHVECLQKLELSLRLRRGLNVVIGEVGTGKTTLCRQLIRRFADDRECETHLILDPYFSSSSEFLAAAADMFTGVRPPAGLNDWQLKEIIKKYIFQKGVDENRILILIIDEGQKIPDFSLEILREFLNFETNDYKLLQIVIFAQKEFDKTLKTHSNFGDRINLYHTLGPMSFRDTREMIRFRIRQSSELPRSPKVFTFSALWAIYRASGGFPRKIINLCHRSVLAMIVQNRSQAGWLLIRTVVKRSFFSESRPKRFRTALAGLVLLAVILLATGLISTKIKVPVFRETHPEQAAVPDAEIQPLSGGEDPLKASGLQPEPAVVPDDIKAATIQAAAVETATAAAESLREDSKKLPSALGRVALKPKETLWGLIEKVYGQFSQLHQQRLLEANPHITNPSRVEAGRLISVPAIPADVKPLPQPVWWIKLEDQDRLDAAIQFMRAYPDEAPPIRMVPHLDSAGNIRFSILLRDYVFNEAAARERLEKLPPAFSGKGEIVSGWEAGTVFFADPYLAMK